MSDTTTEDRAAMTAPRTASMTWDRKRAGWYEAKAGDGSNWRIVQVTSRRWEVYRDGASVADWPLTLTDAKWIAEREQQQATVRPAEDSEAALVELLKAIYEAIDPKAVPSGRDADEIRTRVATVRGVIESITEIRAPAEGAAGTLRRLIAEIQAERAGERS